jgi:hypothetical protein
MTRSASGASRRRRSNFILITFLQGEIGERQPFNRLPVGGAPTVHESTDGSMGWEARLPM